VFGYYLFYDLLEIWNFNKYLCAVATHHAEHLVIPVADRLVFIHCYMDCASLMCIIGAFLLICMISGRKPAELD
jgi:hypothetical protein